MSFMKVYKYWSIVVALLPLIEQLMKEGSDVVAVINEAVTIAKHK